jgi:hypothetical protein
MEPAQRVALEEAAVAVVLVSPDPEVGRDVGPVGRDSTDTAVVVFVDICFSESNIE